MGSPQPFERPSWANEYPTEESFPYRGHGWIKMGYWWIELGGEDDSIADTETIRDELLKIVYGMWDHIKNHGDHGAENWALDWIQFLPGKRESRRYIGDHVLTQNDVEAEGRFEDRVAFGGWTMDDHHPAGFKFPGKPTIFHPAPSPYGISYRCLYSKNIDNLMFAGRCVSASHAAMSSTRVMATAAVMGQALGTAAAMAIKYKISPRAVGKSHIAELQQTLLRDDAYIPWLPMMFNDLTRRAALRASSGNPEPLRDGINRPVGDDQHAWIGQTGDSIEYTWKDLRHVDRAVLVLDSALHRLVTLSHLQHDDQLNHVPQEMVKDLRLEIRSGGNWQPWRGIVENYQRFLKIDVGAEVDGVKVIFDSTWGAEKVRVFAFYME
jgi:hypothetical protein